jgi:hypothetical protein
MGQIDLDTIASFTWFWGDKFFLETEHGNYIWSNPDYPGGDNTIRSYGANYKYYCKETGVLFARDKGKHRIRDYCGDQVQFI